MAALERDKARLHAALGRAERGKARFGHPQHGEVLRELGMKEAGGIVALNADDAQVGQRRYTVQEWSH